MPVWNIARLTDDRLLVPCITFSVVQNNILCDSTHLTFCITVCTMPDRPLQSVVFFYFLFFRERFKILRLGGIGPGCYYDTCTIPSSFVFFYSMIPQVPLFLYCKALWIKAFTKNNPCFIYESSLFCACDDLKPLLNWKAKQ